MAARLVALAVVLFSLGCEAIPAAIEGMEDADWRVRFGVSADLGRGDPGEEDEEDENHP